MSPDASVATPPPFGPAPGAGARAVLFLGGDYEDDAYYTRLASAATLLIAADGGARFLLDRELRPDAVVGDFDSLDEASLRRLHEAGVEVVRHPVRKDQTDGELAVEEALRRGAAAVTLAGALGALDHTLGHLAILRRLAARGVAARLAAPHLVVRVLAAPAAVRLDAPPGTRVSVAPLDGDAEVSLDGLDYLLQHGVLPADSCLGLGNYVAPPGPARIALHRGTVAVLVASGDETFGALPRAPQRGA